MNLQKLQLIRFEAFKTQNPELGAFDVTFDIGGKKLFAHKFMLLPVSTTFTSMLSERWTSKDVPIQLETFGSDDFYQFLTFLYSGECQLSNDNIAAMVDIAEFFQVKIFKDYCDEYLSKLQCNLENVFQLLDITTKYSMDELKKSIVLFVKSNFSQLLDSDRWFQIPKEVLLQLIESINGHDEEVFEKVYEWAENQATLKKESDSNLNFDETVKEILTDFMPLFDFGKMDHLFFIKFIASKSLFPPAELSSILLKTCNQSNFGKIKVKVTDENEKTMIGRFYDSENIYEQIQKIGDANEANDEYIWWTTSHQQRLSQQKLKKNDEIEWYLIYDGGNDLAIKRRNQIDDSTNYLIAEMFAEDGFVLNEECKIEAVRL